MKQKKIPLMSSRLLVCAALLFLIFGFGASRPAVRVVSAQDDPTPTATPTPDAEKERLQREADLATLKETKAKAEQAVAEARKAELEAMFPKPSSSPLEGKTTVDGAVIESQMISYISMARAANRIVEALSRPSLKGKIKALAIYNERDVNLMLSYKVAESQIEVVRQSYCELLDPEVTKRRTRGPAGKPEYICPPTAAAPTPQPTPPAPGEEKLMMLPPIGPGAALPIVQSFLGSFIDMTALLRTNVEIKGQTFVIDEAPMVAEVFRAARRDDPDGFGDKIGLYYPYVFPPHINVKQESAILARLEDVHELRASAQRIIEGLETAGKKLNKTNSDIEELEATINKSLPKRTADAVATSGILIKSNCRRLSAEVEFIKTLPQGLQGKEMIKLIEKARVTCPKMDADKLELLLGLSDTIGKLGQALEQAQKELKEAKKEKDRLRKEIYHLLAQLKLNADPAKDDDDETKDRLAVVIGRLKALNTQFDGLVEALVKTSADGANVLTNYIRTESLMSALPVEGSYWMQLKVISAGGNNRIKTNLLLDIFRGGNRISHSGGAIVQYHLFDSNGMSIASDTIADYTNYVKAGKVRDRTNSNPDKQHPARDVVDYTPPK